MVFMEWKNSYSVGLPEIDGHHRHLFDLLNKAYSACMLNKQHDVFCGIVTELAEYVNYHFTAEERLMEECSYPALSAHREEHAIYTDKMSELLQMISSEIREFTIELVELTQFLMDWLSHHILEVDMEYSRFLAGVRP